MCVALLLVPQGRLYFWSNSQGDRKQLRTDNWTEKIPGLSKYAKLLKGEGLNHSILRKVRISKSHHTVRRFYLCYREDSTINRHPGSGRPFKLAELSFAMVEQLIRQDNKTTATEMYYEQRCGCIVLWKKQYPLINQQHCSILSTSLLEGTLETGF